MPSTLKAITQYFGLSIALLLLAGHSHANNNGDLQFHGFFSQAYLLSDGNNFYGDSQRGSTDYMEAAVNATWRVAPALNIAGQVLSRDAGNSANGGLDIDFLFADLKAIETEESGLGFRLGRVRNAYGFYNDTRDVLFTRSTILMPQAVYFEGNGLRELLFATDGAQLYSYWDANENSTSLNFTLGRNEKSISSETIKNLFGAAAASIVHKGEVKSPIYAQLLHSRNGGDSKFAVSVLNVQIDLHSAVRSFGDLSLDATGYVLSAQKNLAMWTFTGEYSLITTDFTSIQGSQSQKIEAAYLQAQYRLRPSVTLTSRYELSYLDRERRSETDSHNVVLGLRWLPAANWVIDTNIYGIRGTSGIPIVDNSRNSRLDERTEMFAIMIGYRF
ncbi:hypothetical protein [Zhongshania sp.]|uniref:hypothetical protein n=1 Tax=Zhongshania sp. TaxID=1971902 RepID=UPI00356B4AD5